MRFARLALAAALHCALIADTQVPPAIDPGSLINAASRMPSSLSGGALALGARFSLTGVRLGPPIGVEGNQTEPPLLLAGVSIRISQKGKDVAAGILFASAARIDGYIPRSAPLGPTRLTVTYNGVSSEPYAIALVDSSFGFLTPDTAPAELPEARMPVSATPGDDVALWGSGLGDAQPEIFVGGKPVTARRAAEACCQGVDRIEFKIPADAPLGCYVPVQARTAGRPSNVVGIAIHSPGQSCRDEFAWLETTVERARRAGFVALARISLAPRPTFKIGGYRFDYAVAAFGNQQSGQRPFPPLPPFGTCTVSSDKIGLRQLLSQARDPSAWTGIAPPAPGNLQLDAGPKITVSGPAGARIVERQGRQRNAYSALLGGVVPFTQVRRSPLFLAPGIYLVTSAGGGDIGPIDVSVPVQRAIEWKNRASLAEVRRSEGVTLEWKEAPPSDAVLIAAANSDPTTGDSSVCVCLARAKDRRFTIPPVSLGNLPPTGADDLEPSILMIAELPLAPPAFIQARGLDAGFATFLSISARLVKFR